MNGNKDSNVSIFVFIYRCCPLAGVVVLVSIGLSLFAVGVADVDRYLGVNRNDCFDSSCQYFAVLQIRERCIKPCINYNAKYVINQEFITTTYNHILKSKHYQNYFYFYIYRLYF